MSRRTAVLVAVAAAALIALVSILMVLRARRQRAGGAGAAAAAGRFDIAGRILDRVGRPVGGARVLCQPELGSGSAWSSATSDGEGRYRLVLAAGAQVRMRVEADGFVTEELRAVEPPQAGLELTLARRLGLDGLVRAQGRPAGDVEITVGGPGGLRSVKSGPDGAFTFAGLAEGRYAVRALGEAGAAFVDGVVIAAGDGGSGLVTIDLKPAGSVVGRLRDRGGRGVAGGEVALSEADGTPLPRTTIADADGNFRFGGVLAGSYVVEARAAGYYPSEPRPLRVAAARGPATVEVRLERGAVVSGRVVDEQARPVAGAQIEVAGETSDGAPIAVSAATGSGVGGGGTVGWPGSAWAGVGSGRFEASGELGILRGPIPYPPLAPLLPVPLPMPATASATPGDAAKASAAQKMFVSDADGAFRVVGLPAGRLVVAATHADFARGASEPLPVPAGGDVTVTVVLSRGVRIDGRVVDDRGAPVAGAEIAGSDGVLAVTDRRGQYELSHFARTQPLTARAAGFLPTTRAVSPSERGPFDFTLRRAEGHLAGEIVDDRGAPVSAARVEISAAPLPVRWFTTDRGGRFRADGLGPGPYHVAVSHGDYAPAVADAVAPGDDFRLQLVPGGGLDGEVRDARSGAVPPGARVEITIGGGSSGSSGGGGGKPRTLAVVGGRFSATSLPPGRVTLTVAAPGYVTWSRPVEVAGSERLHDVTTRDLRVELERGGSIRGRVRDDHGDAVADAAVTITVAGGAAGSAKLHARSSRDGDFRIDGVAAGRARVSVEREGEVLAAEEVEVRADDETRVELRLR